MKNLILMIAVTFFVSLHAYAELPTDTLWTRNVKPDYIVATDFSPDGSKVLAVSHGGLFVFDKETGNLIKKFDEPYLLYGIMVDAVFSKTENKVFVRQPAFNAMWNWETEELLWTFPQPYPSDPEFGRVLWDHSDNTIKFVVQNEKHDFYYGDTTRLLTFNAETGVFISERRHPDMNLSIGSDAYLSDDGKYLLCHGAYTVGQGRNPHDYVSAVKLWNLEKDSVRTLFSKYDGGSLMSNAAFSHDGKMLAISIDDQYKVKIYNIEDLSLLTEFNHYDPDFEPSFYDLIFTNDSKYLLSLEGQFGRKEIWIHDLFNNNIFYKYPHPYGNGDDFNLSSNEDCITVGGWNYLYLLKNKIFTSIVSHNYDSTLYPNPSNNIVSIDFSLLNDAPVNIKIIDNNGNLVEQLIDNNLQAGNHTSNWNSSNYPSGVYYFIITINNLTSTHKVVIVK